MQQIFLFLAQTLAALGILSGLIIIHEGGHFLFAKLSGIKVLEFSLFMGPKLFSRKKGETEYSIRLIPIGGFVKMEGEEAHSSDERAFNNKPIWSRALVVAGGPLVNILYAIIAYALVAYVSVGSYPLTTVAEVLPASPAEQAGIISGDRILKMDDESIHTFLQVNIHTIQSEGNKMDVLVSRGGQKLSLSIKPEYSNEYKRFMIGISPQQKSDFFGFIGYSINYSRWLTKMTFKQLGLIFTGRESIKTLTGPVGIVTEIGKATVQEQGETSKDVLLRLLNFSAMISLSLGILNLLPVPALDGSKLVFIGIEGMRKKPVSPKIEAIISMAGFAFLIMLIVFITINDIRRLHG